MTDKPVLRVVRGEPSDEELAALVAVVSSLGTPGEAPEPAPRSAWADRRALLRTPLAHGPGVWRASGFPR